MMHCLSVRPLIVFKWIEYFSLLTLMSYHRRKMFIQICNDMRVSEWQSRHVWVNCPFKFGQICALFHPVLIKLLFHTADRLDDSDFTYIRNHPKSGNPLLQLYRINNYQLVLHFVAQSYPPPFLFLPTLLYFHYIIYCVVSKMLTFTLCVISRAENYSGSKKEHHI